MVAEGVEITNELVQTDDVRVWILGPDFDEQALAEPWVLLRKPELHAFGDGMLRLVNTLQNNKINTLFILDKSGHPIGGLLQSLMRSLEIDDVPNIEFLNIRAFKERGPEELNITLKEIELFQLTFGDLYGKNICITDMYSHEGKMIKRAKLLIEAAYPNSTDIALTRVLTELYEFPVWEGDAEMLGVKDRYMTLKEIEKYIPPASGRPIVYTSIDAPTAKSRQLDFELAQFADIVGNNAVSLRVSKKLQLKYTNEIEFMF